MPASRVLIRISELSKSFGRVPAIDRLSLEIREGEFLCLLGPSGCGKSTLLRLLAGLEEADSGRIDLDGQDLAPVPPHRRPLNMMFQSYALFPHLTVRGNVAYGLKRAGLPRREVAARTDEMLRLVRLEDLGSRYPGQISGGQRQRVALARALARRPRLLLLDEPMGALDRRLREETQRELKALQVRLGTTFVTVTHDQDEAMAMADRIAVMDRGRIVQLGSPRAVYEHPDSRFVAEFIGDVNILDGVVAEAGPGRMRILGEGWSLALDRGGAEPAPGRAVAVAVRPERVGFRSPNAPPEPEDGVLLPARIMSATFVGGAVHVVAATATGQLLRGIRPAGEGRGEDRVGEAVAVFLPRDAVTVLVR